MGDVAKGEGKGQGLFHMLRPQVKTLACGNEEQAGCGLGWRRDVCGTGCGAADRARDIRVQKNGIPYSR